MKERYQELDSLRGLAALSVVLFHLGFRYFWPWVNWLPLRFFWAGHQAVILFFVLSGFVLSLPYYRQKTLPYPFFVMRRVARIWLPYIVIVGLAFSWRWAFHQNGVPIFSKYRHLWETPLTWQLLLSHLGLIVGMDDRGLIPTAWSLVHEMRISLIFPFLMMGILALPWRFVLGLAVMSSLAAGLASIYLSGAAGEFYIPLSHTLYFLGMFMVGCLLAQYRIELVAWSLKLTKGRKILFSLAAYVLYTYGVADGWKGAVLFLGDWAATFGAAAIILIAMSFGKSLFLHRWPIFLGHISYSLYLVHLPILCLIPFLFVKVAPGTPVYLMFPSMLAGALVGGTLFWYFIERPVVAWCKTIGSRTRTSDPTGALTEMATSRHPS